MHITEENLINIIRQEINEGLIKSYDIDMCKKYFRKKFPNIQRIVSLRNNPYLVNGVNAKAKYNDFVGIDLDPNNIDNFRSVIKTVNDLLGWFTGHIELGRKVKIGHIEYYFYNFNGVFIHLFDNGTAIDLNTFLLQDVQLSYFRIVVEAKFSEVYHHRSGEIFYHCTDASHLDKILRNGLVPKSQSNFPERIYLGKDVNEIWNMVGSNIHNLVILKVDVTDIRLFKLYRDQRNPTSVFTYDNIPPSQLEVIN